MSGLAEMNTIDTQQLIFNDLYGSEFLKTKYSGKKNFTYFNYLLKMHNKYYQDEATYHDIFGEVNTDTRKET